MQILGLKKLKSLFCTPTEASSSAPQVVIGCDGTKSAVARHLALPEPNYAGYSAIRGVAHFPKGHNQKSAVRQIWGAGVRAGTYPMNETDVYWFTTFNSPEGE
jgi:2-polyprenyl-6-methoxyphenol hydroxylase-like FAD-dependent oxidoreductase